MFEKSLINILKLNVLLTGNAEGRNNTELFTHGGLNKKIKHLIKQQRRKASKKKYQ